MACKQDRADGIAKMIGMTNETKLLDVAELAAEDAGKKLLKLFRSSDLWVRPKYDYAGSIVTKADKEAEKAILARIKRSKFKGTVYSEEAGNVRLGSGEILWAVDPLDGTFNYAKGVPYFAVSIGVLIERKPLVGVIYNPILDEMFTARRSWGAFLNGKKIHVSSRGSLRNSAIIFEWWDQEPSIPAPLAFELRLRHFTRNIRKLGSIALNLCEVATGRFDGLVIVFRKSPVYEVAAGCLIVQEARGRVTNSSGKSWENFSSSIVAGSSGVHEKLLSLIRSQ